MAGNILLVDDSRVLLKMIERVVLEKFPEHKVYTYSNPELGLEEIKAQNLEFEFALVDYNMKEMNGIEFLTALFQLDPVPVKKENVSMLSANIQEAVRAKAADLGLSFIAKPLDADKLDLFIKERGL